MAYCPKCKKFVSTKHNWEFERDIIKFFDSCTKCGTEIPNSAYYKPQPKDANKILIY